MDINQLVVAGRYALTYTSGAVGALVAVNLLSPHDAADITTNIELIGHGVGEIGKGIGGLVAVLVPIYSAWRGVQSASASSQVKFVITALSSSAATQTANAVADPASRNDLINAVSKMPEVKAIVTTPAVAAATASPKVTSGGV